MAWKQTAFAALLALGALFTAPMAPAHASDAKVEQELAKLDQNPLFAAIYENIPGSKADIRSRLLAAYKKGGLKELQREGGRIGQEYGAKVAPKYLARATDNDLLYFVRMGRDISGHLLNTGPDICFSWLFAPQTFDAVAFAQAVGPDMQSKLNVSLMNVVTNAHKSVPAFDKAAAQADLQTVATTVMQRQSPDVAAFFSGTAVMETREQKKALCNFNYDLYKTLLEHPRPVDLLRLMFLEV